MNYRIPWFIPWLSLHQRIHRHAEWFDPDDVQYYQGWMECFQRHKFTEDEVQQATKNLQAKARMHPDRHLEAIKADVYEQRKFAAEKQASYVLPDTANNELGLAMAKSTDCPECQGTGWARRRFLLRIASKVASVDLYCRCAAGRYRESTAPDRHKGTARESSDLQAYPDLWMTGVWHHTWSTRPTLPYHKPTEVGWYLAPDQPAPDGTTSMHRAATATTTEDYEEIAF